MFRQICSAILVLFVLSACAKQSFVGSFEEEVDISSVRIKQFDRTVTYYVDPALDNLEATFGCGILADITYDWGDTIGNAVRETFDLRFANAIEVPASQAEFGVGFNTAFLQSEMQTTWFTVNADSEFSLVLNTIQRGTGEARPLLIKIRRQHVIDNSICSDAPALLDQWTPDLMRVLMRELSNRVLEQASVTE